MQPVKYTERPAAWRKPGIFALMRREMLENRPAARYLREKERLF